MRPKDPRFQMLARLKVDPFVLALLAVIALAALWPAPGVSGGPLHADVIGSYGVGVIFLLYGMTLAADQMWRSMGLWREHLLVQGATFLLFPAIVFAAQFVTDELFSQGFLTGLFFLAALPSTVSSSVAMTSLARGNVPLSIFNASISSLIGVFVTPVLMAWYLHTAGSGLALTSVILKLLGLVLVPIAIGQMLRPLLGPLLSRHKGIVRLADRSVISGDRLQCLLRFHARRHLEGQDPWTLPLLAGLVILLFFSVYGILSAICRLLGLKVEDRISVLFCGSKKSLVTGLPMAGIMFGASPQAALIIAPLMMYHLFQLLIVSFIASGYARRPEAPAQAPEADKRAAAE